MDILSTIVFAADTSDEAADLEKMLIPHLHASRADRLEVRQIQRQLDDVNGDVEVMIYVIVHTGNILGMIEDLKADFII